MKIAVILPVIDESARLAAGLADLIAVADRVVVADGGSTDNSREIASSMGAEVVRSARGRALQMNAGAARSQGAEVLVFVHADVVMPRAWRHAVERSVAHGARWGRFNVQLDSSRKSLKLVGAMMNLRSRLTGIATGDQAIFVTLEAWEQCGGWPEVELMEDIRLSAQLLRLGWRPACLREPVRVSARRWEQHGVWRTIALMWWVRALHWLGASPRYLHGLYYRK
jgi:rSAM/selenodomain-associated transferase 2